MKKLIITLLIIVPFMSNGQVGKFVPIGQGTYLTVVDTSNYKTKVSDTLFVTDEHIKFISIGGRVYEILPPTLKEVEPNRLSNIGTLVLPFYPPISSQSYKYN